MNIPKNWRKGCLWIPFGRGKKCTQSQLNGKANTGEEGAGMGRNRPRKSAFGQSGLAWCLILYQETANSTRQACSYAVETHLLCPSCLSRMSCPQSSPQFPGQATRKAIRRSRRTCSNMAPNHHKTLLAQTQGKCLLDLRDSSTWWEGWCSGGENLCGKGQKSVWVSRRRTIITDQLLVSLVWEHD